MMNGGMWMVVLIVLIGAVTKIVKERMRAQDRIGGTPQDRIDTQLMVDEMRRLRDRVAVLERIATDGEGPAKLDREIEALRRKDL